MVPSRLDPERRAVFKLVGQNQAELAWLAVLCFWRPCKSKHSDFQVAYRQWNRKRKHKTLRKTPTIDVTISYFRAFLQTLLQFDKYFMEEMNKAN